MVDLAPIRGRLAKCLRLFGSAERANARLMTERALASVGASWTDFGNWIEQRSEPDDGRYTEAEMAEFAQAARAEGVEAGIKIDLARARNGNGNLSLPKPSDMAQYCHDRLNRLKDHKQRDFVIDMFLITRRERNLSLGRLGYLASIYIQIGGRI